MFICFLVFQIRYVEECAGLLTEYEIDLSVLVKENEAYSYWWRLIFRNIFSVLLPFATLAFMNIRIVVAVQKMKRVDRSTRRLSDAQQKVFFFFFCFRIFIIRLC